MEKRLIRLIFTFVVGVPFCYIVYLVIIVLAVPKLLSSSSTIPTYTGFYIQYPNLVGEVFNLQCVTNGQTDYAYSHYCRFNGSASNIYQFIGERQLLAQDFKACLDIDVPPNVGEYPQTTSWKPSDLEEEGECYASGKFARDEVFLLYSPTSQLAYMQEND
ncbi:hypothetical protein H6F90_29825 [Trichocoleus sp. FACHB-591]|uniref:hypothetical protein n=1 Tax=Trichocoleus sp. FACHB-591 TaxID=2692872 RepID=UPI0016834FC4|nr:hypothetical protein [Trichocoleus sp. FACHB-591]MBD2099266.1 hypothetical protein [Trichocoleus sp. FACHB-591]